MTPSFAFCFIGLYISSSYAFEIKKTANFVEEKVDLELNAVFLKGKIVLKSNFGRIGSNLEMKCSSYCFNDEDCSSFYTEDGACVFGLTADTGEYEGEVVTPDANKIVKEKRE